jgi:hypothetical protein
MSAQYYSKSYQPPYQQPHYRHEHQQDDQYSQQQGRSPQQSLSQQGYNPQPGYYPQQGFPQGYQQIVIQQPQSRSNGLGIAGFILALLGLLLGIIPFLGFFLMPGFGFLGFIFSFIGVFKAPRGFAIAGLVISFIILMIMLIGGAALWSIPAIHDIFS